jgi:hypothetical protein
VIRRPTGITGSSGNIIQIREVQVWVNGSNILFPNSATLISYFAQFNIDVDVDVGQEANLVASNAYNNNFENDPTFLGAMSSTASTVNTALIIKNIPLTIIDNIQSLVLYNRINTGSSQRIIGLAVELYNSTNDPDLTEVLATTNVITTATASYRFDFSSISTYTGSFATADSTTNIVSNSIASTKEANVISYPAEITGDLVANGVNINTTLADILSRLELLENP